MIRNSRSTIRRSASLLLGSVLAVPIVAAGTLTSPAAAPAPPPANARFDYQIGEYLIDISTASKRVRAQISGQPDALVDLTPAAVAELALRPGQHVWLSAKATEMDVYPRPPQSRRERHPAQSQEH